MDRYNEIVGRWGSLIVSVHCISPPSYVCQHRRRLEGRLGGKIGGGWRGREERLLQGGRGSLLCLLLLLPHAEDNCCDGARTGDASGTAACGEQEKRQERRLLMKSWRLRECRQVQGGAGPGIYTGLLLLRPVVRHVRPYQRGSVDSSKPQRLHRRKG